VQPAGVFDVRRSKVKVAIVLSLAILALVLGLYAFGAWWDRVVYLRWMAWRQAELQNLGWRVKAYAQDHDEFDPRSVEDLVAAGILAPGELKCHEPWRDVRVTRAMARSASGAAPHPEILLVETYSDPIHECNVLLWNGRVELRKGDDCRLGRAIREGGR
jgi:hypothetical protein